MQWCQIKAVCSVSDLDEVCSVMCMVDNGLMIEDYSDIDENLKTVYGDLIDESILNADKTRAAVSIYLPTEKYPAEAVHRLRQRFDELELDVLLQATGLKEEDWAQEWKKYYKPVRIGKRIVVVPAWEEYDAAADDVIITMDPGMAFGTGSHETTRLVAALIEKYIKKGDRVLDVGTGSGILAVIASKLGAAEVNAYDIDPVAVRVARENIKENRVQNVTCGVSDLLRDASAAQYDLITANIVADIIIRMSGELGAFVKPGTVFIASGIITEREDEVLAAMAKTPLALIDKMTEGGWCALAFRA